MLEHLEKLQDTLDDAIRRAYCQGWRVDVGEIHPDEMAARILESPGHMRQLAYIQKAAWDAVWERVAECANFERANEALGEQVVALLHELGRSAEIRKSCGERPPDQMAVEGGDSVGPVERGHSRPASLLAKLHDEQTSAWQDYVPETLIDELQDSDEYVQFTDEWRGLSVSEQIGFARHWLRKALGLEEWR